VAILVSLLCGTAAVALHRAIDLLVQATPIAKLPALW